MDYIFTYTNIQQAIGRKLGIHESLVNRHPFPGPGIAIRILGDVTQERVEIARQADHIFISKIKEAGLYDQVSRWIHQKRAQSNFFQISQAFAAVDTNRSVGVFGDQRVWGYIIILRAVQTKDFMSAEVFNFDHKFLAVSPTPDCFARFYEMDGPFEIYSINYVPLHWRIIYTSQLTDSPL